MSAFTISLRHLKFFSAIGVFEQERRVGNEFIVNLTVRLDAAFFVPEDLSTTVSYADLYETVASTMGKEWLLLESAAKEIADNISVKNGEILEIKVEITKTKPPISGMTGEGSVEYHWSKGSW